MKNNRLIRIACAALFASGLLSNAHANPEKQSEGYLAIVQGALPATSTATDAISESLMFKGADLIAKQINREGQLTRIGEYEWEAKAATRNRKDRQILVDQNSQDYEIGLARTLRLPSKGRLDEQMGSTYDSISNLTRMDGWHETARVLNQRWYDCVQAGSSLELGRRQLASLSEFESQQAKRLAAGEISAVQHEQAQLEVAQARLNLNTLQSEADLARKALVSDFPLLGSATDLQACIAPSHALATMAQTTDSPSDTWVDLMIAENHGLELASMQTELSRSQSQRADADRTPDPTVGLTLSVERDNAERILGFEVGIPLSGQGRQTKAQIASLKFSETAANEARIKAQANLEAQQTLLSARTSLQQAQQKQQQSAIASKLYEKLRKAYNAGEITPLELKLARDQAREAENQAVLASVQGLRSLSRLLIDSHQLWAPKEEH